MGYLGVVFVVMIVDGFGPKGEEAHKAEDERPPEVFLIDQVDKLRGYVDELILES